MAVAGELKSVTADAKPISGGERLARIAKGSMLMSERKVAALLIEPGVDARLLHWITLAPFRADHPRHIPRRGEYWS